MENLSKVYVILETSYNLDTGKDDSIKQGDENKSSQICKNKVFMIEEDAHAVISNHIDKQKKKGAVDLSKEDCMIINRYFRELVASPYYQGFKLDNQARCYYVRELEVF